ncbi:hypothetical protein [Methylorubrum populi]|uniref:hypothetical protein n=1 Tax=Methylorubrum populi TaxID=223967 RepID=UPI00156E08F1|nr:hypothetical protein [Methylorubrum populi]
MPETNPVPPPPVSEDAGLPTPPSPGRLPPPNLPPAPSPSDESSPGDRTDGGGTE